MLKISWRWFHLFCIYALYVIKIPLRTQPRLHILRRPGTGPKASAAYQDQWKGYRMFCGRLLQVDWHPTSQFAPLRYCSPTAPPSGRGLIQLVVKTWIHSATMQKKEALLEDKTEFNLLIPKTSKNQYSHVDHLLLVFFGRSGRPATTVGSRMTQTVSATLDAMSPVELGLDAGRSRTQRPRSGSKFWEQLKCKVNTLVWHNWSQMLLMLLLCFQISSLLQTLRRFLFSGWFLRTI